MKDHPQRRPLRLEGYDYAQEGAYFVTVVTQNRECLLGDVAEATLRPTDAGLMVERWWLELARKFPGAESDAHIVMPNHLHGILVMGADKVGTPNVGADLRVRPAALPRMMQWIKTMTTNEYMRGVHDRGWAPFAGRLWQRSYYDHVIRSEEEMNRVRQYIVDNPARWAQDRENPAARR